ncbi:MAG TPA: acetyl-CoA C-acetyltransferase [Syntrophales bacterium]|nr:acetyl-CoA C-acetyltransferase [Syntrophales bacterium]
MKKDVVIVDALRTAVGSYGGSLTYMKPYEIASVVLLELLKRNRLDPNLVDQIIMGNCINQLQGGNVARLTWLQAKLPVEVPALTVDRQCGSGLWAIDEAALLIRNNEAQIIVAGGTENMSNSPYWMEGARWGYRLGNNQVYDAFVEGAKRCCNPHDYPNMNMGLTAENVAEKYGISREAQDDYALTSQGRAAAAIREGRFKDEIVPIPIPQRKGDPKLFDTDEYVRMTVKKEDLAKLRPAFKKNGTVTAGNASGMNDGACLLLVMAASKAKELGYEPIAYVGNFTTVGVPSEIMGIGPAPAIQKLVNKSGSKLDTYDLLEINEAFAAQACAVLKLLEINNERVNVNGGAIAIGHPLGASGARITTTLIYEMKRRGYKKGIASLCCGGGLGVATEFYAA